MSDPEKRRFYDAHGEEGLKLKEAYDQMDPSMVVAAFAHSGWKFRACFLTIILVMFLVVLLPVIFLCLKVDHDVSWGWYTGGREDADVAGDALFPLFYGPTLQYLQSVFFV